MSETTNSHLFALRTTGGQEKVVLRQLEAKMRSGELDVQSVLIVENLKGYVVIEANDPQSIVDHEIEILETMFSDDLLEKTVKSKGIKER